MNNGRVHAKIALVTGAGSGIGRATAILLANEGATVVVSDIDTHAAEQVVGEIRDGGGVAEAARLDVADESAWMMTIEGILDPLISGLTFLSTMPVCPSPSRSPKRLSMIGEGF